MTRVRRFTGHQLFLPVLALTLLMIYNIIYVDNFLTLEMINGQLHGRLIDILNRSASLIVITIGMTFVVGAGGIDISVGSIIAITGAVACYLIGGQADGSTNLSLWLVIPISILVGGICGIWNGFLVAKLKIQPIVATLILQTAGRGIAMLITQGQILTVYHRPFAYIGGTIPGSILPTTIFIAALIILATAILLKKTSFGLFVQSVGINRMAARYSGMNITAVIMFAYVISGLLAGLAGVMESSMISAADANNAGYRFEANAILSVALGGTLLSGGRFTLAGSIIGAITIQTLTTTMYARGVNSEHLPVIQAIVVILITLLQSDIFKAMFRRAPRAFTGKVGSA